MTIITSMSEDRHWLHLQVGTNIMSGGNFTKQESFQTGCITKDEYVSTCFYFERESGICSREYKSAAREMA